MSTEAKAPAPVNMIQALNWALHDAMEADKNVIVFGEEIADPEGGGIVKISQGLSTKYGARVRSTPISEMGFMGAAVGAAVVGMRPVVEIMLMNFVGVCMDQITNHAAKLRFMSGGQTHVPMVIRTMTGSGFQNGGQHSDFLEAWFCHTPGIKVVMPSNPADGYGLLLAAIADDDPVIFVEHLNSYWTPGAAPERGKKIPIGKARIHRLQPLHDGHPPGGGEAGKGRHRLRSHRPAHRQPARHRHHPRLGQENRPRRGGARGRALLRRRRGSFRAHSRVAVQGTEGTGTARCQPGLPGSLCAAA